MVEQKVLLILFGWFRCDRMQWCDEYLRNAPIVDQPCKNVDDSEINREGGGVDRRGGPKGEQQPRSSAKLLQLRPPLLTFDCWQSLRVLNNAIWNWLKDEIKSRGSYRIPAENLAERKERSTDRNRDLHHTQSNRIAGIQTNKEFRRIFR